MLPIIFEIQYDGAPMPKQKVKPSKELRKWQWIVMDFLSVAMIAIGSVITIFSGGWMTLATCIFLTTLCIAIVFIIGAPSKTLETVSAKALCTAIIYCLVIIAVIFFK
ncbi:MAG: hypothetical protein WCI79_02190 [Candidatus Saccharibacteria bacterium]